jgi:5-(carboxyamino)imidazole ribonucleotide mutase
VGVGRRDSEHSAGRVFVILGSPADESWGDRITKILEGFGVNVDTVIASAHKTPQYLLNVLKERERLEQPQVYITVAGRSNALSGFVDAQVLSPVIACPPSSEAFAGMDILSSLRMPRGVAPMVVLEPENAALAAVKILGLADPSMKSRVGEAQDKEKQRVMSS